jgi:hypothetical protein
MPLAPARHLELLSKSSLLVVALVVPTSARDKRHSNLMNVTTLASSQLPSSLISIQFLVNYNIVNWRACCCANVAIVDNNNEDQYAGHS